MKDIELGSKVRDRVSGFTGIAICISRWMNGCIRVSVAPDKLDKDGKVMDSACFDAQQVEVLEEKTIPVEQPERPPGGPFPAPTRNPDPK